MTHDTPSNPTRPVWFITGAARGIGREIALAALAAGHQVAATGRDLAALQAAFAGHEGAVQCLALDVAQPQQAADAVAQAVQRFGRIDVLVNNAGYGQLGLFEEIEAADIERQFATNVFGLMHVTRAVLPQMRQQRAGRIFNLASIGGFAGFESSSVYCAAKFAVEGFSESLALEVARFGIQVTVVEPGFFRTDFLARSSVRYGSRRVADYPRVDYESYNGRQPGDPARLGRVVVQLAAMAEAPLHFVAGSDALQYATQAFERRLAEVQRHAALSVTTDLA